MVTRKQGRYVLKSKRAKKRGAIYKEKKIVESKRLLMAHW